MHPADEYARLKAEIQRLTQRADALRQQFLHDPALRRSKRVEVVIRSEPQRHFRRDRLPRAIQDDPALWEERCVPSVVLREHGRPRDLPTDPAT